MYVSYKSSTIHLRKKSLYRYLFSQLAAPPLCKGRLSIHKSYLQDWHTQKKTQICSLLSAQWLSSYSFSVREVGMLRTASGAQCTFNLNIPSASETWAFPS